MEAANKEHPDLQNAVQVRLPARRPWTQGKEDLLDVWPCEAKGKPSFGQFESSPPTRSSQPVSTGKGTVTTTRPPTDENANRLVTAEPPLLPLSSPAPQLLPEPTATPADLPRFAVIGPPRAHLLAHGLTPGQRAQRLRGTPRAVARPLLLVRRIAHGGQPPRLDHPPDDQRKRLLDVDLTYLGSLCVWNLMLQPCSRSSYQRLGK